MVTQIRRIVDSRSFQRAILSLIVLNAVLMGIETSAAVMQQFGRALLLANGIIQLLFVTEIVLRIAAHLPRVGAFFRNGWNLFDFVIVALSLLPMAGALAGVARLARVLRVARLISVSPGLRLIVRTMLLSIPSMGHVLALVGLLLYIYAVIGVHTFGAVDPTHWSSLGRALLTLFTILTLEGWADMQAAVLPSHPWAWLYFCSFIVLAVFVVVNLFIAVVTNNLQAAKAEEELEEEAPHEAGEVRDVAIGKRLEDLSREVVRLRDAIEKRASGA